MQSLVDEGEAADVFGASPNAYLILSLDMVVTGANDAYCRLTGRSRSEMVGRSVRAVFPQAPTPAGRAAQASIRRSMRDAVQRRQRQILPRVAMSLDGRVAPAASELSAAGPPAARRFWTFDHIPLLRPDGSVHGLLQHATDVSEQVLTETALRRSEAQFRVVTEALPLMVWSAREDGRTDFYNRHWYRFTGFAPQEVLGAPTCVASHPQDRPRVSAAWHHSVAEGTPFATEYRLRSASGGYRWVVERAVPMRDEVTGALLRWFGTTTDIDELVAAREALKRDHATLERLVAERTAELAQANQRLRIEAQERVRAEAELRRAEKLEAIGQLTGGIAHDFNNLLTLVLGGLETIRASTRLLVRRPETERIIRATDLAASGAERAARLTAQLLAFARQQPLQAQAVDCDALLAGLAPRLPPPGRDGESGPRVAVLHVPSPQSWRAQADRRQLEQALQNLVANAREAMPKGGTITLASANHHVPAAAPGAGGAGGEPLDAGDYVMIEVADTGLGMDAATAARACEPFFTTKETGQGSGLGLSQVYGFVRQSHGHMQIDGVPGEGTRIRLFLPRAA